MGRPVLALVSLCVLSPVPLRAQAVQVPDEPACRACFVRTVDSVLLGEIDGPGALPTHPTSIEVDGRGRFWLTFESGTAVPHVFSSDGTFIAEVGREGRGPGEFVLPVGFLPVGGDSMVVFHGALARATIVGPDLRPARVLNFPGRAGWGTVLHWPDSVLVSGRILTPERHGFLSHLLSFRESEVVVLESFAETQPVDLPFNPLSGTRRLSDRVGRSYWTSKVQEYELNRWNDSFEIDLTLTRRPSWFVGPSTGHIGSRDVAPAPMIDAIYLDSAGLVWVVARRSRDGWRDAWPANIRDDQEFSLSDLPPLDRFWHSTVEVIDPIAGRVVARSDLDGLVLFLTSGSTGPRAAFYREDPVGRPFVRVSKLELAGREGR